jgi:hemerythrin-like domain-containing protein
MKRAPALVRLSWDHHHGLVLAHRIATELPGLESEDLAGLYSDVLAYWAAGLLPHFHAEHDCLLARLIRHIPDASETIEQTQRDHLDITGLVADMRDAPDQFARRAALEAFGDRLRAHIRWEEAVLFEIAQTSLSEAELATVGREVDEALPSLATAPL